jgi:hypothetical protein
VPVLIYNSFDFFFVKFDRLMLFKNFTKNKIFKAILKVHYRVDDIIVKIKNNYDFFE